MIIITNLHLCTFFTGIIHRAVCGSHILINSNGHCMLTGLKYSTSVLKDGRWHNTIHDFPQNALKIMSYFAPEILQQNIIGYNSKSDIYSLGISCCEMANGYIPFEGIELTEMLFNKLTGKYPRPLDATCEEIIDFPYAPEGIDCSTHPTKHHLATVLIVFRSQR